MAFRIRRGVEAHALRVAVWLAERFMTCCYSSDAFLAPRNAST
jgi:hypothetical protein